MKRFEGMEASEAVDQILSADLDNESGNILPRRTEIFLEAARWLGSQSGHKHLKDSKRKKYLEKEIKTIRSEQAALIALSHEK